MAKKAADQTSNEPSEEHVQDAVKNIEGCYTDLLKEKSAYMTRCKKIREIMASEYDTASDRGISKKLLKSIVKERDFERKIAGLQDDLEPDERSEREMLTDKLGDFGNLPLGKAAINRAGGAETLSGLGA